MYKDFEDFLTMKHGEDYIGTDDCMPDAYVDWTNDLGFDDWIKYGDMFAKEQSKELLEACKKVEKHYTMICEVICIDNPPPEGVPILKLLRQAIAKAEGN